MIQLTCCVCGNRAPARKQWWNRDRGFGLCGSCATHLQTRRDYNAEEFHSYYGDKGIHWIPDPEARDLP